MPSSLGAAQKGRDLWKQAREKKRMRARFQIRERVATSGACSNSVQVLECNDEASLSLERSILVSDDLSCAQIQVLTDLLRQLEAGRTSAFSVRVLADHYDVLSKLIPTTILSEYKIRTLCTSRFGQDYTQRLLKYVQSLESCSILEYAVWLGEYPILSSLLSGGLDPTMRGRRKGERSDHNPTREEMRRISVSTRVVRRFFDRFPKSLSGYVVKRVVDMRIQHWTHRHHRQQQAHELIEPTAFCLLCKTQSSLNFGAPCLHETCENCVWEVLLEHIDLDRHEGDVVRCAVCGTAASCCTTDTHQSPFYSVCSPSERREQSLQQYHQLPMTVDELKRLPRKKRTPKRDALCSSWPLAVSRCVGSSQDVRRDKFFASVERNTYHFVKGCLVRGIDVNLTNEYGQTALFIAAWRGYSTVVQALLEYGADASIEAPGGLTALLVSQANGRDDVVTLLREMTPDACIDVSKTNLCWSFCSARSDSDYKTQHTRMENTISLIDPLEDHPGAGSCLVDNAISSEIVDSLIALWKSIPVDTSESRKKNMPKLCSARSYFCDAEGHVTRMLTDAIQRGGDGAWENLIVYPHMRFLHYSQPGTLLPPHVDLSRTDLSGRRSTHTFILYLFECENGGETLLLGGTSGDEQHRVLARVSPRRGRLLLFPHACPHSGNEVIDVPKVLLRGEVYVNDTS